MSMTLTLPAPLERRLLDRAAADGKSADILAFELLDASLRKERTFAEICEPIRRDFEASGMTEEELDDLIEEARQEVWEEQQAKRRLSGPA